MTSRKRACGRGSAAAAMAGIAVLAPIGVAQSLHWERPGASALDEFGAAVGSAGDVDGDGAADVIVGASRADVGAISPGRATVHSGRDGSVLLTLDGRFDGESFGHAVGAAGDVDGDGRGDVFVSAPNRTVGGASLAGNVTIFSGADGSELAAWNGASGERFGWSVARLGDADGDGRDEFVVGAPRHASRGLDRGRVHVLSMAGGPAFLVLQGEAAGDWFGVSVAACGDTDGDGAPDFAVGADRNDLGGADAGRAYLFALDGRLIAAFDGAAPTDRLGAALAGLDDFDGDGLADLLAASPQHDGAGINAGRVTILSARQAAPLLVLDGDASGDLFGSALAAIGDLDCDGRDDFAVGAWANDQAGASAGKVSVRSGAGGGELFALLGVAATERFGIALAGAGDVDASGCRDLVVGASFSSANGTRSGRVAVWRSDFEPPAAPQLAPQLTGVTPGRGDHRVATAVTLTGDEFLAGGAVASFGTAPAHAVVVVDDETIICDVPPGEPGPVDVTVQTDFGVATLAGGFVRTPALLVEGAPAVGAELTLRFLCEPGELVIGFFGLPPARTIPIRGFDHHLAIRPFVVLFVARARGDELVHAETIPDHPGLAGLELLVQGITKRRGANRGSFTNVVPITIE